MTAWVLEEVGKQEASHSSSVRGGVGCSGNGQGKLSGQSLHPGTEGQCPEEPGGLKVQEQLQGGEERRGCRVGGLGMSS